MAKIRTGYDGRRLNNLLTAWSLCSAVAIGMPVILLVLGCIVHRISCRNGNGEGWCRDRHDDGNDREGRWIDQGWPVMIFAFVWSYLLFVWIAAYGHAVLSHILAAIESGSELSRWRRYMCNKTDDAGPYNMGLLTGATILFGNLSFLLGMVLSIPLGSGSDHLFRRSSIIPFAFLLWALFCLVFSCWLLQFQPLSHDDDNSSKSKKKVTSDYRRAPETPDDVGGDLNASKQKQERNNSRGRTRDREEVRGNSDKQQEDGTKKKSFFGFNRQSKERKSFKANSKDATLV